MPIPTFDKIDLELVQEGWKIEVAFRVKTRRQFTEESHTLGVLVETEEPLVAVAEALVLVRKNKEKLRSLPGEFDLE